MDLDTALATPFTFEWRGKKYSVSRVTQSIKGKLGVWLKQRLLDNARATLPKEEYESIRKEILVGSVTSDVNLMQSALASLDGSVFMLRCLMNDPGLTDEDLVELVMKMPETLTSIFEMLGNEIQNDPKAVPALLLGR